MTAAAPDEGVVTDTPALSVAVAVVGEDAEAGRGTSVGRERGPIAKAVMAEGLRLEAEPRR
ncbi:hypothetical protein ACWGI0_12375 [Streptomyces sp. NPDC054802]